MNKKVTAMYRYCIMSAYPPPTLNNGVLNQIYNSLDYDSTSPKFLKLSGGAITGDLTVSGDISTTDLESSGTVTTSTLNTSNLSVASQNVALGSGSSATGSASLALMKNSTASANNSIAIGQGATATHSKGVAIGFSAATSAANEIVLGATNETIKLNKISPLYSSVPNLTGCIGDIISGTNYGTPPSQVTNTIQTYRQITFTKGRYLLECEVALTAGATAGQFEFFVTDTPTKNNVFGSASVQYSGTYETYYKFYNFNFNANATYYLRATKQSGSTANVWYIELKAYRIG